MSIRASLVAAVSLACAAAAAAPPSPAPPSPPSSSPSKPAPAAITRKNFYNHPDIVAVREVVAAVDKALPSLMQAERRHPCGGPENDALTVLWSDAAGRPCRLEGSFGGEDSLTTVTATYDDAGQLRFLFVKAGAVSGHLEQRYWRSPSGTLLFQLDKEDGGWSWWRPDDADWKALQSPRTLIDAGICSLLGD